MAGVAGYIHGQELHRTSRPHCILISVLSCLLCFPLSSSLALGFGKCGGKRSHLVHGVVTFIYKSMRKTTPSILLWSWSHRPLRRAQSAWGMLLSMFCKRKTNDIKFWHQRLQKKSVHVFTCSGSTRHAQVQRLRSTMCCLLLISWGV